MNIAYYSTANGPTPTRPHDGKGYLAFNTTVAGGGVDQSVPINAPTGSTFVASAWMSAQPGTTGTVQGQLCLWGIGGNVATNNCTPYALTAGVWQQVQVVYTVTQPQTATALLFQIYANPNNGTTNLDTASIT